MASRKDDARLFALTALAFIASVAMTVTCCDRMSAMTGMQMPGGWTLTMTWSRMPGQTWWEAGGIFLAMWTVMMVAMMLPTFAPALRHFLLGVRHRRTVATLGFAAGYFGIWSTLGVLLFPVGACFNALALRSAVVANVTPLLGGLVVIIAGALQFTPWKNRALVRCRHTADSCGSQQRMPRDALRAGARLGLKCAYCCAPLTSILLVTGVMNLLGMALITFAIGVERLIGSANAARVVGAGVLTSGIILVGGAMQWQGL